MDIVPQSNKKRQDTHYLHQGSATFSCVPTHGFKTFSVPTSYVFIQFTVNISSAWDITKVVKT